MDAVVDEAGGALLAVAVGVDLGDQVGERRLARAAVAAGAAGVRNLADRLQAPLADRRGELLAGLRAAGTEVGRLLDERRRSAIATSSVTASLQEPQPVPARVLAITSRGVAQPPSPTAATISPLQTPLQLQICAVVGQVGGTRPRRGGETGQRVGDLLAGARSRRAGPRCRACRRAGSPRRRARRRGRACGRRGRQRRRRPPPGPPTGRRSRPGRPPSPSASPTAASPRRRRSQPPSSDSAAAAACSWIGATSP